MDLDETDIDIDVLAAVLDRLLPAREGLTAAGQLGLADDVVADAASWPPGADALRDVLAALPADFRDRDEAEQVAALEDIEESHEGAFAGVVNLAYNAYYTDNRVRALLEERTGYAARAPQPEGYDLPAFDDAVLEQARQREPFWRKVEV